MAENLLRQTQVRSPAVQSRPVYERPGYRTLLGRIRENVRTYIRKQLELPRQEILLGDLRLLVRPQGDARRLLTVAQRRIEDMDPASGHEHFLLVGGFASAIF